jgi:serine/threonine protein kinase
MSPVADYNLKEFLNLNPLPPESRSFLQTFFGCLTAALKYLHENRIRHKDIKPQASIHTLPYRINLLTNFSECLGERASGAFNRLWH